MTYRLVIIYCQKVHDFPANASQTSRHHAFFQKYAYICSEVKKRLSALKNRKLSK